MFIYIYIHKFNIALFCYPSIVFNGPDGGFPWVDLRKILHRGQRMAE